MRYTVVLTKDEDQVLATVPGLNVVATGDTEDEAISNVRDAIDEYLVELRKLGAPAPVPSTKAVIVEAA